MKSILNTTCLRQVTILETLYYADDWMPVSKIASITGYPIRTIQHAIPTINQDFTPLQIEYDPIKGLSLLLPNHLGFEYVYEYVYATSYEFLLLETIFWRSGLSTNQLSDQLFISPSTTSRIISKLNRKFRDNKMSISISNKQHSLVGDEIMVRNFMFRFLREKYSLLTLPYPSQEIDTFQQFVIKAYADSSISLSFYELEFVSFVFIIVTTRERAGYSVELWDKSSHKHPVFAYLLNNKEFSCYFMDKNNLPWNLSIVEQVFSLFLRDRYFYSYADLTVAMKNNENLQLLVQELTDLCLKIATRLNIQPTNFESVILKLVNSHVLFVGSNYILYDHHQEFLSSIAKDYPFLMAVLFKEISLYKFYKEFTWTSVSQNQALQLLITQWGNLLDDVVLSQPKISILIACTFEPGYGTIIKELVYARCKANLTIDISNAQTLGEFVTDCANYDIILNSTNKLNIDHQNVLHFSSYPQPKDLENLLAIIKELTFQKQNH